MAYPSTFGAKVIKILVKRINTIPDSTPFLYFFIYGINLNKLFMLYSIRIVLGISLNVNLN